MLRSIILIFDIPLRASQTEAFRGAIISLVGTENTDLFHNHRLSETDGKLLDVKRYPMIQYKSIKGKAAIVAWQEGVDVAEQHLFPKLGNELTINGETYPLKLSRLNTQSSELKHTPDKTHTYSLFNWLPLNGVSYQSWKVKNEAERLAYLEYRIKNQIRTFAKGMGVEIPNDFVLTLEKLDDAPRGRMVHGTKLAAFNAIFISDLLLPPLAALGRSTALGYGNVGMEVKV